MAQSNHVFTDLAGVAHLAQLNEINSANVTLNSGATEPATKYAGMSWLDTSGATPVLKQRNQANDGWDAVSSLLDAEVMPSPTAGGYRRRNATNDGDETVTPQEVADEVVPLAIRYAPGHIHGLTLSNNTTDANNDVDIASGSARDSADAANIVLSSAITKRLDAVWAAGTGNGGLDTGAKAVSTTYHLFLIRKDSGGTTDVLFSLSATAPTMPSGYTAKRRIGSVYTNSTGNLVPFSQRGDEFLLKTPSGDVNVADIGTTATLYALSVPSGIQVNAIISARSVHDTGSASILVTSPDQADTTPASTILDMVASGAGGTPRSFGAFHRNVRTNTNCQVRVRSNLAGASLVITTQGWIDTRGRD